jgi:ribosomal-protein-alanine N-acetyltransferase
LASEAVSAVLAHAFTELGYERLVSETQAANQPSRRLLERVGMRPARDVQRFGAAQMIYAIERAVPGHIGK